MALQLATRAQAALPARQRPTSAPRSTRRSVSRPAPRRLSLRAPGAAAEGQKVTINKPPPPITLSDAALEHLIKLREESGGDKLLLRMGVKSGGCSGMSYVLDFESEENVTPDDLVSEYEGGFKIACDSKSLLYLFGMQLDWSPALIGGGFQFQNPNAENSCGCGKSFGV